MENLNRRKYFPTLLLPPTLDSKFKQALTLFQGEWNLFSVLPVVDWRLYWSAKHGLFCTFRPQDVQVKLSYLFEVLFPAVRLAWAYHMHMFRPLACVDARHRVERSSNQRCTPCAPFRQCRETFSPYWTSPLCPERKKAVLSAYWASSI